MSLPILQRKEVYGNWTMLSPSGEEMCKCAKKKADWYLSRNLATLVESKEKTFRLIFQPAGNGNAGDEYYLGKRDSKCVVCGIEENLTRHHVVPYAYRKNFSLKYKSHSSHDIIVICDECHVQYHTDFGNKLIHEIDEEMFVTSESSQIKASKTPAFTLMRMGLSSANTLVRHREKIPPERQEILWERIEAYFGYRPTIEVLIPLVSEWSQEREEQPVNFTRGCQVAKKIEEAGQQSVEAFSQRWRQHFVDSMMPKFLPVGWRVDKELSSDKRVAS